MNRPPSRPAIVPTNVDRLAEAVGDVQAMHQELVAALSEVGELRTALNRETDRVLILTEAHDRWRAEALIFRTKLIELATQMASIGLLTITAQEVIKTVNELNNAGDTPNEKALDTFEEQLSLTLSQTRTGK